VDNLRNLLLLAGSAMSLDPPGCRLTGQDAFPMLGHEEESIMFDQVTAQARRSTWGKKRTLRGSAANAVARSVLNCQSQRVAKH